MISDVDLIIEGWFDEDLIVASVATAILAGSTGAAQALAAYRPSTAAYALAAIHSMFVPPVQVGPAVPSSPPVAIVQPAQFPYALASTRPPAPISAPSQTPYVPILSVLSAPWPYAQFASVEVQPGALPALDIGPDAPMGSTAAEQAQRAYRPPFFASAVYEQLRAAPQPSAFGIASIYLQGPPALVPDTRQPPWPYASATALPQRPDFSTASAYLAPSAVPTPLVAPWPYASLSLSAFAAPAVQSYVAPARIAPLAPAVWPHALVALPAAFSLGSSPAYVGPPPAIVPSVQPWPYALQLATFAAPAAPSYVGPAPAPMPATALWPYASTSRFASPLSGAVSAIYLGPPPIVVPDSRQPPWPYASATAIAQRPDFSVNLYVGPPPVVVPDTKQPPWPYSSAVSLPQRPDFSAAAIYLQGPPVVVPDTKQPPWPYASGTSLIGPVVQVFLPPIPSGSTASAQALAAYRPPAFAGAVYEQLRAAPQPSTFGSLQIYLQGPPVLAVRTQEPPWPYASATSRIGPIILRVDVPVGSTATAQALIAYRSPPFASAVYEQLRAAPQPWLLGALSIQAVPYVTVKQWTVQVWWPHPIYLPRIYAPIIAPPKVLAPPILVVRTNHPPWPYVLATPPNPFRWLTYDFASLFRVYAVGAESRALAITAETRAYVIAGEVRTVTVAFEDRGLLITAENRAYSIPGENRSA